MFKKLFGVQIFGLEEVGMNPFSLYIKGTAELEVNNENKTKRIISFCLTKLYLVSFDTKPWNVDC